MSYSGDAAEQVVRMSLETGEVALKLAGAGAKEIAVMLYAILKEQNKTRGKARLESMLRSGKELKVFAVKDDDLQKFCQEAKKYGVLYCVLKDRDATDGITDIMVRAEDAGKINRIFERFQLSTVDMASIREDIEQSREGREGRKDKKEKGDAAAPEKTTPPVVETAKKDTDEFLDALFGPADVPEELERENPTEAGTGNSRQSGPTSERQTPTAKGTSDEGHVHAKPSVRQELKEIREEQRRAAANAPDRGIAPQPHIEPKKKYKTTVKEI